MVLFSSFFFLKKRIKIQGSMPSCKKWKPTQSSDFKRFANSQNRLRICSRFCMGLFFKQSCMRPSLETVFLVHFYVYQWCLDFQIRIPLQMALLNFAFVFSSFFFKPNNNICKNNKGVFAKRLTRLFVSIFFRFDTFDRLSGVQLSHQKDFHFNP